MFVSYKDFHTWILFKVKVTAAWFILSYYVVVPISLSTKAVCERFGLKIQTLLVINVT